MSEYTEEQAKADADALVARLASDPGLRQALDADPHGTLVAAGIPEDVVGEVDKALAGAEVEGFMHLSGPQLNVAVNPTVFMQLFPQHQPQQCVGITTPTGTGDGGSNCCGHN